MNRTSEPEVAYVPAWHCGSKIDPINFHRESKGVGTSLIHIFRASCLRVVVSVAELLIIHSDKLPALLELKYHAVSDAVAELGGVAVIREAFVGFQRYLYEERT